MIKRLVIKNCLGIEELVINAGQVNIVSGGNEVGKTSILGVIEKALCNTQRGDKFIKVGKERAYIEIDTDEGLSILRTVGKGEGVKVTQDNIPVGSPETFLKGLFGGKETFAFNPVDFMLKKDTEQTAILLKLLPIAVSPENANEWFGETPRVNYEKHGLQVIKDIEKWFYDLRAEANSRVKATKDESEAIKKRLPDNYKVEEWEGVKLGEMFNELSEARTINQGIESGKQFLANYEQEAGSIDNKYSVKETEIKKEIEQEIKKITEATQNRKSEILAEIAELEKRKSLLLSEIEHNETILSTKTSSLKRLADEKLKAITDEKNKELTSLKIKKQDTENYLSTHQPIDTSAIQEKCTEAEKMKSFIPLAKEVVTLSNKLSVEEQTANHYDDCVGIARRKPAELLSQVELPLEGLGINDVGIITINELPLSNLSTSKQIKVCLDIARATQKNAVLKLICVDKLEHLDPSQREEFFKQIEADKETQYFVTQVTEGELKIESKGRTV